jgi:transcriptional regulator with XRE-family HTH domain
MTGLMRMSIGSDRKENEMAVNVNEKIKALSATRRRKVETRAAQLIAEEMTLRELRRARKLTQVRMAKKLGITQDSVSRLEKRSDLLLSTLRKTVQAMGGNLSLVAEFPDRAPVVLSGISDAEVRLATPGAQLASRRECDYRTRVMSLDVPPAAGM